MPFPVTDIVRGAGSSDQCAARCEVCVLFVRWRCLSDGGSEVRRPSSLMAIEPEFCPAAVSNEMNLVNLSAVRIKIAYAGATARTSFRSTKAATGEDVRQRSFKG